MASGNRKKRFKKSIPAALVSILLIHVIFWTVIPRGVRATLLDDIKAEIQAKEEEIRKLEGDKKQFEQTITQKQKAQRTLKNQIALLVADIERLSVQQRITTAQIQKTELTIQSLQSQIAQAQGNIETQKGRMSVLLRTMRERADEHKTLLSLILQNTSLSLFLGQLAYAESLQDKLLDETKVLKQNKFELENEEATLLGKKDELQELRGRLVAEREAKNSQQQQKSTILITTRNEEKKFKELLSEAEARRQGILKDIKELEDKLRRTIDPASLPAFRPGVLEWPVRGIVSQEYGDTKDTGFQNDAYEFHNGIDVAGQTGIPIRAARDGVIKAVGNNSPYAYGRWIAVDHGNNLTTLYAHLSSQAVKQGSTVKKGQVVGYMGSTGFATGPHLHFTVYASNTFITEQRWFGLLPLGGSINPRSYLL